MRTVHYINGIEVPPAKQRAYIEKIVRQIKEMTAQPQKRNVDPYDINKEINRRNP